jgi:hypothetical protein
VDVAATLAGATRSCMTGTTPDRSSGWTARHRSRPRPRAPETAEVAVRRTGRMPSCCAPATPSRSARDRRRSCRTFPGSPMRAVDEREATGAQRCPRRSHPRRRRRRVRAGDRVRLVRLPSR